MKNEKEKDSFLFQDINSNNKSFSYKIFKYYYSLYQAKKKFNIFVKYILIFIETIQLISYSFSSNHLISWKINQSKIAIVLNILYAFRISFFMKFLPYKIYSVILYLLVIIIFVLCLTVILNILYIESPSKIYQFSISMLRKVIEIIIIIFYIPITEIILIPIKCIDGKVNGFNDGETCWEYMHYINISLGIFGAILLFILFIFLLFFNFYPFQTPKSANRISSNNDVIILIIKLFFILQNLLITNRYVSMIILLLSSTLIFLYCYDEPTYNNNKLEIALSIRNSLTIWTNFILLLCTLFGNVVSKGLIFLLIVGYPLMISFSFVIILEKDIQIVKILGNNKTLNEYINKAIMNIKLINSFIEKNNQMINEKENQRNIILLRGNIKIHSKRCLEKDCPLTKFVNNEGNYNIQKQCLLNYMNCFFNKGLKIYPNSVYLIILFMHFNYSKKFNLNSVRSNLIKLKKIECSIKEKYIIYCIEQNIKNKDDGYDFSLDSEENSASQVDLIEQKYQKLKYLIENSIKLYGEFWGIFTTNVTSKINTNKLYSLGEKLNIYLKEMNNLWENELKNRRVGNESRNIVQLYSKFLQEILWDQKKSLEVYKKLNDENINNNNLDDIKVKQESNNVSNIDQLIDHQDYLLMCDSDERGNCKIIQSSSSFAHLLGYQRKDIIGKSIDIIYPNILIEEHCKYLEECISLLHNRQDNNQNGLNQENESDNNSKLIILKNRMGYIYPLFATFQVIDDNDYSDSFLIKIKMENKQAKSEYPYFILTNPDFIIENISSSAINLGLFLDLLKKYVLKIDILIRSHGDQLLNLYENFHEYEEEAKNVTWVFPDLIYPKDNIQKIKEDELEGLIEKSQKKVYNLQISPIRFNGKENIAFLFKLTELPLKNNKSNFNLIKYIPKTNENLIMFDLFKMHYIRTLLVKKKSGFRNLRSEEEEKEAHLDNIQLKSNKNSKKRKKNELVIEEEDYSSENSNNNILLTKEKIIELQVNNYADIRNFIFSLPIYGTDVAIEKFRPNGDKYSASKITESLIKIHLSEFCKRVDESAALMYHKKKSKKHTFENHIDSPKSSYTNDYLFSAATSSSQKPIQNGEMNKGLSSNSSSAFETFFKTNTIKYIEVLIGFLFFATFIIILTEFIITYKHVSGLENNLTILRNSYIILNNILYTKYYVTEGVITIALDEQNKNYSVAYFYGDNIDIYLKRVADYLASFTDEFVIKYDFFVTNTFCKEYTDFMETKKIIIKTLTSDIEESMELFFTSALSRYPSTVNELVTNPRLMHMRNRNTFELMNNLLNEFYVNWQKITSILYNDGIEATKFHIPILIIDVSYFIISIVILIVFLKLLSMFSLEREKPINLFLTLKKVVFENLKNSAENFSNKLLNKFLGNEGGEDDSQQDYQSKIQPKDINIAKFKANNEYNSSIKSGFYYMKYLIIIAIFPVFNFIYFIIKYSDFRDIMKAMNNFISLYDKTFFAEVDFMVSINIFKSFLFNKSIPVLNNNTDTTYIFIDTIINLTNKFEESYIFITNINSFLSKDIIKYQQYLVGDCVELLSNNDTKRLGLSSFLKNGVKPIEMRAYEILRFYEINYCTITDDCQNTNGTMSTMSKILEKTDNTLITVNVLHERVNKKWYEVVLRLIGDTFHSYENKVKLKYIAVFVCLIIIIILYYTIIWKMNEQKLNVLLKGSVDLINLIPQEIKNIIIEKLNEN